MVQKKKEFFFISEQANYIYDLKLYNNQRNAQAF
jgi:hypothetical protein